MIYLTGDTHGNFNRIYDFCEKMETSKDDVIIILGDVAFNYSLNELDLFKKQEASEENITFFCIKGNHEKYAGVIDSYKECEAFGGIVYVEPKYPNILFAKDGEVYTFNVNGEDKKALVIGGAYSVDKHYRIEKGLKWFDDEQPSIDTKELVEEKVKMLGSKIDYVFSHTCPYRFLPREWFLSFINSMNVDYSTEEWLDNIYDLLKVEKWYCGHFHGEKVDCNIRFLFEGFVLLGD